MSPNRFELFGLFCYSLTLSSHCFNPIGTHESDQYHMKRAVFGHQLVTNLYLVTEENYKCLKIPPSLRKKLLI